MAARRDAKTETKNAVNATLELFQRKWLLRVVWELHLGPKTFRALQEACDDLSPTVVNCFCAVDEVGREVAEVSGRQRGS